MKLCPGGLHCDMTQGCAYNPPCPYSKSSGNMWIISLDDTKAIMKHWAVHAAMRGIVLGRLVVPQKWPTWRFADRDNPVGPFKLLRECVRRAILAAAERTENQDKELRALLRMDDGDDIEKIAEAVATAVEDYAVTMQFGPDGLRDYRENYDAVLS